MPLPTSCVRLSGWLHEVRSPGWGQDVIGQPPYNNSVLLLEDSLAPFAGRVSA